MVARNGSCLGEACPTFRRDKESGDTPSDIRSDCQRLAGNIAVGDSVDCPLIDAPDGEE